MDNTIDILIIEDDVWISDYLKELLTGTRAPAFSCSAARNLSEGGAYLEKRQFDIVLLDLGLPDSQGIQTALTLRKRFPGIPIIVLTGLDDEGMAINALKMDIQDYLIKGQINGALLVRSIRYAIERKRALDELRESEERFREVFAYAPVGMVVTDLQGRYLHVNQAFEKITGYTEGELSDGHSDFKRLTHPDDIEQTIEGMKRLLAGELRAFFQEKRYIRKDGNVVWVRVSASVRRNSQGKPFQIVGLIEDISEQKRLEEQIRHMAQHDALTGLPNRRLFNEIMQVELAQARRHRKKIGVLFLDLDRFKEINDTLGHATGDELLKETASRLRAVIRVSDTVARIGGDEFNVIIPDVDHPELAAEVAQKILNEIRKPFTIRGRELNVSTSIGISVFPHDSEEMDTLLRYADIAMYHAKEKGRNNYQFYNPIINSRSIERTMFENSLRRAIAHNEFRLFFQPLVNVKTRDIISAEVLLRWQHPDRGLLLPGQFFGPAQEIGFMPEIDEWVLKAASKQITAWIDEGISPVCVTVNLSRRQFQSPDLVKRLSGIFREAGMPPECLDLEITEAVAMGNIENTIARIKELTGIGVHVSIDDFGTGYSSLNHLRRLPIRKLKIDKSFVRDIATDSDDRAIISAVLLMAHSMKVKVVAEGVEGNGQLSYLRDLECDEAQGFLFSAPLPADKFKELVSPR